MELCSRQTGCRCATAGKTRGMYCRFSPEGPLNSASSTPHHRALGREKMRRMTAVMMMMMVVAVVVAVVVLVERR